jgi:AraC-like DNA-binding protein
MAGTSAFARAISWWSFPSYLTSIGPVPPESWTEFYLMFDGPVFDLWRAAGLLDPRQPIHHLEPIEYWAHRLESVLGAPRQPGHAPPLQEICRLQLVLSDALLAQEVQIAGDEATWVDRASALLDADVERELDLHDLARELGMSYDGFRKRFARAAGMPPSRYRGARAIDRACELMQGGNLTDRQIAERLGFCDEFYFSRRFKQLTGRSPRQFRAELPRTR